MKIASVGKGPMSCSPWQEMENASLQLNRLFGGSGPAGGLAGWNPPVNVEETDEEIILAAELPGLAIEDIEIEVTDNVLSLKGEKTEEGVDDKRRYHLRERSYGSFKRSFAVPRGVKTENISAEFKDGILHVRLPKAPEAKSRKITIKSTD